MNRIRRLRERSEYTQQKIADYLGVCKMTYIRYENGDTQATEYTLVRLADLYNVSVDYLVGRSDVFEPFYKNSNDLSKSHEKEMLLEIKGLSPEETKYFYALISKINK